MPVGLDTSLSLLPVAGVRLATAYSGIRKSEANDVTLIACGKGSRVASVYTRNQFCAAPVQLCRLHGDENIRYLLINAGNANAGTGQKGLDAARQSCQFVAQHGDVEIEQVLPFSTGVIGEYLPVQKIEAILPTLFDNLSEDNWLAAAKGIMTTDTCPKAVSETVSLSGDRTVTITGMSKGAGMICPDMATMLAYVATDADVPQALLDSSLSKAVETSFNSISVDGDMSTNDSCVLIASGASGVSIESDKDVLAFQSALESVFQWLAQAIVRDAEGIEKYIELDICGAGSVEEAKQLGYAIAHSPLVKTAFFAGDPNWGRILAVIGRAGLDDLVLSDVSFSLNGVSIVKRGERDPIYTEEQGVEAMSCSEITIHIELNRGDVNHKMWTCDLGYEYVKINAEYRT